MQPRDTTTGDVVYFDDARSAQLFHESESKSHFWTLCRYFVSEKFLTYCGVATAVTVLNSLGVESPDEPQIYPYKMFTQDNIFTDDVLHIHRPRDVERNGLSLAQLAKMLNVFAVEVEHIHADSIGFDDFHQAAVAALRDPSKRVAIDFDRKTLGQKGAGHFSPLAAYHEVQDRFLIMDVARYKLPPAWVKAQQLWSALCTLDPVSQQSRGFLIVTGGKTPSKDEAAL